jgi:hypothetical protein
VETNATPSLWLHAYSGREHGLMIIGTPASIKDLAQQLLNACNQQSATVATPWPPAIATPNVVGPYKDIRQFGLSFHLQGAEPLEKVAPFTRRTLWPPVFFLAALFSVVGVVTVLRWLISLLGLG